MITKTKIKAPPTVNNTAKIGVNVNSPTVVKADSPGDDLRWLTGALVVNAWILMGSERPEDFYVINRFFLWLRWQNIDKDFLSFCVKSSRSMDWFQMKDSKNLLHMVGKDFFKKCPPGLLKKNGIWKLFTIFRVLFLFYGKIINL